MIKEKHESFSSIKPFHRFIERMLGRMNVLNPSLLNQAAQMALGGAGGQSTEPLELDSGESGMLVKIIV